MGTRWVRWGAGALLDRFQSICGGGWGEAGEDSRRVRRQGRQLHFFFIKFPEDIQPLARAAKYEDPLQVELTRLSLGEITGVGSQLASGGGIEYCGIDVELTDRQRGLELIVETMRRLQVPPETVVEEFEPEFRVHRVYGP